MATAMPPAVNAVRMLVLTFLPPCSQLHCSPVSAPDLRLTGLSDIHDAAVHCSRARFLLTRLFRRTVVSRRHTPKARPHPIGSLRAGAWIRSDITGSQQRRPSPYCNRRSFTPYPGQAFRSLRSQPFRRGLPGPSSALLRWQGGRKPTGAGLRRATSGVTKRSVRCDHRSMEHGASGIASIKP
jgi:hypothetical protein